MLLFQVVSTPTMLLEMVVITPGLRKVPSCLYILLLYLVRVVNTPTPLASFPSPAKRTAAGILLARPHGCHRRIGIVNSLQVMG